MSGFHGYLSELGTDHVDAPSRGSGHSHPDRQQPLGRARGSSGVWRPGFASARLFGDRQAEAVVSFDRCR